MKNTAVSEMRNVLDEWNGGTGQESSEHSGVYSVNVMQDIILNWL